MEQSSLRVPAHVAFIPDGNRRYARAHGLTPAEGYLLGVEKVTDTVRWLLSQGVRHVSAYAASQENVVERSQLEITAALTALSRFIDEFEKMPGVGVHVFGDLEALPAWVPYRKHFVDRWEPRLDDQLTVHLGLNYGGSSEQAYLLNQVRKHGLEKVAANYDTYTLSRGVPAVDLLFRSGGQSRLSGFLPFQTAYSELWFTEKYWPDVAIPDVQEAFDWYAAQKRNFGK